MRVCVNASHTALLFLAHSVYTIVRWLYGHRLSGYSSVKCYSLYRLRAIFLKYGKVVSHFECSGNCNARVNGHITRCDTISSWQPAAAVSEITKRYSAVATLRASSPHWCVCLRVQRASACSSSATVKCLTVSLRHQTTRTSTSRTSTAFCTRLWATTTNWFNSPSLTSTWNCPSPTSRKLLIIRQLHTAT